VTLRAELTELTAGGTTDEQVALAHAVDAAARVVEDAQAELAGLENAFQENERAEQALRDQAAAWHVAARASDQVEVVDERDITRVEAEIEVIGEVDEALVQAHTELADRVSYLEAQATDMEVGVKDLRKVLTELERRIQTTFEKNFARINAEYAKQFARLFRGGTAALELTRYEDDEYGIEITAKPPGKRVELLSSLSGGERALAAIALLAAILSVNPSPFVVLDEVDAALDDANAQLFTETLKQLARHSQLLVITHNHETMLSADALYGITTTPKAASTVIAVDLQAAEALTVR
jgi:chromosome segregation protein